MRSHLKILILGVLAFAAPLHAADTMSAGQSREQIRQAVELIKSGENAAAVAKADALIAAMEKAHPGGKTSYFCADDQRQILMVLATAASNKQDAEITDSSWCEAHFLRGFALINLKRSAEAGMALQKAAEMAPLNAHYVNEYAEWHKASRNWQQAIDMFRKAMSLTEFAPADYQDQFRARSLRGVGFSLIELGNLDDAEAAFKESLTLQPGNTVALAELEYIGQLRAKK
jgi:tetratricopeptide (TPR) repeat protein